MTTFDPFAEAENATDATESSPGSDGPDKDLDASQGNSDPFVSVTLKGGASYDSPWTVLYFENIEDADRQLEQKKDAIKRILDNSATMGGYYSSKGKPAAAPQASAQEAPGGEERFCAHGKMTFRSGVSKSSGKPYQGFFCAAPDRNEQCKPQFMN